MKKPKFCAICQDTPGYAYIKDPRKKEPEKIRCPRGCKWEKPKLKGEK